MSRRFATLVAAFTLLSMLLAACGGATEPPTAAQPTAAPSSDTAAQPTAVGPTAAAVLDATPAPNDATPIPLPTPAPETSLLGSGATKIVWWHINT